MTTVPSAFRNACMAELVCDENGEECRLDVSICIHGRCYSNSIDLRPLVSFIDTRLRAYHARLHAEGQLTEEQVAGFGDWYKHAKNVAKRIAANKGVHALYSNKLVRNALFGPATPEAQKVAAYKFFGPKGPGMVDRAYDALRQAKDGKGKEKLDAIQKLAGLANEAAAGNPEAAKLLQATKAMHYMEEVKAAKEKAESYEKTYDDYKATATEAKSKYDALSALYHSDRTSGFDLIGFSISNPFSKHKKKHKPSRGRASAPLGGAWGRPGAPPPAMSKGRRDEGGDAFETQEDGGDDEDDGGEES